MKTFWYIILMVNAILLFFVLPVGMWFYEAADESIVRPSPNRRVESATPSSGSLAFSLSLVLS